MDFESINQPVCASVVLIITTCNINRPYGFGRNGAVFGVAPSRNEEHWLGVAPPNPTPFALRNIAAVFRTEDTRPGLTPRTVSDSLLRI